MDNTESCLEVNRLATTKRTISNPPNFNDVLAIAKCTIHKQPRASARRNYSRSISRINNLDMIPETNTSNTQTNTGNEDKDTSTQVQSSLKESSPNCYTDNHHSCNCAESKVRQALKRSATHSNMSSQVELKSGIVVFISQGKDNPALSRNGNTNNIDTQTNVSNNNTNNINNRQQSRNSQWGATFTSCRTPVMLKVYRSSLGRYAVMTPSRRHQGLEQPLCIRLKRSQVTVNSPSLSPTSPQRGSAEPCSFVLTTGGEDGKCFKFEASSQDAALDWARAISPNDDANREMVSRGVMVRSPLRPLYEQYNQDVSQKGNRYDNNVPFNTNAFSSYNKNDNNHGIDDDFFNNTYLNENSHTPNINRNGNTTPYNNIVYNTNNQIRNGHNDADRSAQHDSLKKNTHNRSNINTSGITIIIEESIPQTPSAEVTPKVYAPRQVVTSRPTFQRSPPTIRRLQALPTLSESSSESEEEWSE